MRATVLHRPALAWLYRDGKALLPPGVAAHLVTHHTAIPSGPRKDRFATVDVAPLDDDEHWFRLGLWRSQVSKAARVVAPNERFLLTASRIRDRLGLPGMSEVTARGFRNKVLMKELLANGGLRVPRYSVVRSIDDIYRFYGRKVRSKSVIKRVDFTGSMDTHVVHTASEAVSCWHALRGAGTYEIEDYVDGTMYHVDAVVVDSSVTFASVCRYLTKPGEFRHVGFGGSVLVGTGELTHELSVVVRKAVAAMGLEQGVIHFEVFDSADGIVCCEIAARPAGGHISDIVRLGYSVDLVREGINADLMLLDRSRLEVAPPVPHGVWGVVGVFPSLRPCDHLGHTEWRTFGVTRVYEQQPRSSSPVESTDYERVYVVRGSNEKEFDAHVEALVARLRLVGTPTRFAGTA